MRQVLYLLFALKLFLLSGVPFCCSFVTSHGKDPALRPLLSFLKNNQAEKLSEHKLFLVSICSKTPKAPLREIKDAIEDLEALGEQLGIGQASSSSGLLSGEWELLYAPKDGTRSSPFFGAFLNAFPESADQIFGITDSIPGSIKEVGPAFQTIDLTAESGLGSLVSKVKLSAIGGFASSIMTTRATIIGIDGLDGIRLKIDTTKPEDSTILQILFGPFGSVIQEYSPAFPSGNVLEQTKSGSSEIILRTSYCDKHLRVSRNNNSSDEVYVWKRREISL